MSKLVTDFFGRLATDQVLGRISQGFMLTNTDIFGGKILINIWATFMFFDC